MSARVIPVSKRCACNGWRRLPVLLSGAVLGLAALAPHPASAGDWKFDHDLTAKLTAVDRDGDNGYSGEILQVSPHVHLKGSGARVSADIDLTLIGSAGTGDTDPKPLTPELLARGRVEAVEDFFWIGANARAALTGDSSLSGPVDSINYNVDNGRQVYSYAISPEFRQRLNRYAEVYSRNSLDYVTYSGGNSSSDDGSRSYRLNLGVQNGRAFGPMSWNADVTHRNTKYDSDDRDDTNTKYTTGLGYRFSPQWAMNGNVGYEENDVVSDRGSTDGFIWDLGGDWTPNPRTSVSASAGERYFGEYYKGTVRHRSRRTLLSLELSRDISNRRTSQLVDSLFFLVDGNGNVITDPNTGSPITVNIPQGEQVDEDYTSTYLRGGITLTGRRSNVVITGYVENREYEVSPIDEDSYGLSVNATRRLGSNFSATLGGSLSHVEGTGNDNGDTYDVRFSLSKQVSVRTSVSLDLLHRDQNRSTPGNDYTENRAGLSLTSTFL